MKNQYVGDINDYVKYIVLQRLSSVGLRIGICWMLTGDNNRTDGKRISYLQRQTYREYNPMIYDALKNIVSSGHRSVSEIQAANIVSRATYYNDFDSIESNATIDMVFLDPDNGFEVKSVAKGKVGSERYVFWEDVASIYNNGYSLMVYQHFPRVNRINYINSLSFKVFYNVGSKAVFHIHTNTVDFVVIPQMKHRKLIERTLGELRDKCKGLVEVNGYQELAGAMK